MATPLAISEIIKQAAVELGLTEPSGTLVTSTNPQVQRLLQAALQVGRKLRNDYFYPQLLKLYSFSTTTATQYNLPPDFWKMIPGAQWDVGNRWRMGGPVSPQIWYLFQFGTISTFTRTLFYVSGYDTLAGQFFVNPAPANGGQFAFPYIRSQFFFPKAWTTGESIGATGIYRSSAGNIYVSASTGITGATAPDWTTGTDSDGTVSWTFVPTQEYGTNQKFSADTDFCLIDDDLFIMGVKAYYLQSKGYEGGSVRGQGDEMQVFLKNCEQRDIRLDGAPILRMGTTNTWPFIGWNNIPEGSYS